MQKYQKLSPQALQEIQQLRSNGVSPAFIGKFAQFYYGVARSTVYRYVSENRHWYDHKERAKRLELIQEKLCEGYTTQEIAQEMNEPLAKINKLIEDNHISYYKCTRL